MRNLFKLYQFWISIGLFLLALFFGWGLPMLIPSTPHNGIIITIFGVIISLPFLIWAFVLYKREGKKKTETRDQNSRNNAINPALDLKKAIAKTKIAGEELIYYWQVIRKSDINMDENKAKAMVLTLQEKEQKYTDSLELLEIERLISGKDIAEFVKQQQLSIKLIVGILSAGTGLDPNSMNNFEIIILQMMSKIDEINQQITDK